MNIGFKQRLAAGEQVTGTFVKTPSPMICEVLALTGLDLVCIDAEHAPFDRASIDSCLLALRSGGLPALVRVPSAAPEHILNALDCGATGVVVPHITSAGKARDVIASAHFGRGGRGYAGSTRAAGYTTRPMPQHLKRSAQESTVVLQIEDVEAVEAIDEIVAVEGIDCLFIGRVDLAVAMGAESPGATEVVQAMERVCSAATRAGLPVGMFLTDPGEIAHWAGLGAQLFLLGSDHGFILQGARSLAESSTQGKQS
ncbi:MAG: HpcH/HpaI aldolase/citrate lyase family protein [Chromatocurvus sp.]